jgi:uncharacterized protein YqeY
LRRYDESLHAKPRWLVINKRDLLPDDEAEATAKGIVRKLRHKGPWFLISGVSGRGTRELADEVMRFLEADAERRREAAEEYTKVGAQSRAQAELAELAVLEAYLPAKLSEAEVEALARAVIAQVGATSPKELGKVMGPLVTQVSGRADGKLVSAIVRRLLGG